MLCEVPLTKEQQAFATAHHSLVYKFLNENRLPEDEFYDVVIFGYLKAVRDYFSDLTAQQFTFSTIANRRMKFCLFDYFRTQERRKTPEIYNDATACVWRDGTWQLLEDTSKGFLLFVQSKSKEESAA